MSTNTTLHGRDRELARLALAIGSGTDGTRFARVHGPAGVGKTLLVGHAATAAAARGFEVIVVRGRAGSLGTPLAPLADAFTDLQAYITERHATRCAIENETATSLVRAELLTRAAAHPQLLIIDDAQALDASSLALLGALLSFDADPDVSVVLIEQTDAPAIASTYVTFIEEFQAGHSIQQLELAALGDTHIAAIVQDALELGDGEDAPQVIVDRACGNPWFALELSTAWQRGEHDVPRNVAAAAISRLQALPSTAREFVQLCAISPTGVRRSWLDTFATDADVLIEAAHASGLVAIDQDTLVVRHPLMRSALVGEMSIALRRVLHRELADLVSAATTATDAIALRAAAYHRAAGGRPIDAAVIYQSAAAINDADGLPHEAYADLVGALACETRINERVDLLRACARSATYLGIREAVARWNELGRMAAAIHDDELYAYALVQQYWASHDGTAIDRLRRAANLGADRIGWAARAAATIARLDGHLHDAVDHDTVAIDVSRQRGDAELEVLALEKLASSQALLGNTGDAIHTCRTAIERAVAERFHDSAALTWGCLIESLTEELAHEEALVEARAADAYVTALGLTRKRPAVLAWQTSVLIRMGDIEGAARVATEAVELDLSFQSDPSYRREHFGALVALLRADVANELGDANAMDLVDRAAAKIEELGYHSWQLEVDFERARAIARRDGVEAALPYVADVESSGEPAFVASVARWLVRAGVMAGCPAAIERVRELRAVDYAWIEMPVLVLTREEIDATLTCLDGDDGMDALRRIAARWRDAGRALDALRVDEVIGAVLIERGDVSAARTALRVTFTELSRRNAAGDVDQVAALLRRTGSRTRAAIRQSDVGSLTQRELEIARLAASGARNREIATSLFITENTVTAHMTNVYDKTGLGSRVRLAQWLREHDTETSSVSQMASVG